MSRPLYYIALSCPLRYTDTYILQRWRYMNTLRFQTDAKKYIPMMTSLMNIKAGEFCAPPKFLIRAYGLMAYYNLKHIIMLKKES